MVLPALRANPLHQLYVVAVLVVQPLHDATEPSPELRVERIEIAVDGIDVRGVRRTCCSLRCATSPGERSRGRVELRFGALRRANRRRPFEWDERGEQRAEFGGGVRWLGCRRLMVRRHFERGWWTRESGE